MKKTFFIMLFAVLLISWKISAAVNVMHHFTPGNVQGSQPYGDLISDGTYLYGMTSKLGQYNCGTIFRLNLDGSNYLLLHAFAGGGSDGRSPYGSLVLSGTTLYGMTSGGGDSNTGTIFKIEANGTGFGLLHEFASNADDGGYPYGSLVISGSTLYGMTYRGGDINAGTIFKIETNGSGFSLLHEFLGGADDGSIPMYGSALLLSGSTLYGVTTSGGDNDLGTVFKIETNGTDFSLLYEFAGGNDDGAAPIGSLLLSGTTLYGMTRDGGDTNLGSIYKIGTDGTGYTRLHEFVGGVADGDSPQGGSLVLSGTTLFGMTYWGGDSNNGTVFKIETSGTGFSLLREFSGSDGDGPFGSLLLSGSTLFGMTMRGGLDNIGAVFKLETAGTGFASLFSFDGLPGTDGGNPRGTPIISGTTLYGMTSVGGVSNVGTIYKMETNGTGYSILHEFAGSDGATPYGTLLLSGSTLYGMTYGGGSNNLGTIFAIGTNGAGFAKLHDFIGGATDGSHPFYGALVLSGSTLYGMTYYGGSEDQGTLFRIETNGTGFSLLHTFTPDATNGAFPYGGLVISGSTLYGMTTSGGASNRGTIFKIGTNGAGFALLRSFTGDANDGRNPRGDLLLSGSTLYGMTSSGGANTQGTVFKIGTDGNGFSLLHSFSNNPTYASTPYGSLILSDSILYGMTYRGGTNGLGTVFKVGTDGSGFALLNSFAGGSSDGAYPFGSLVLFNGTLFGMTNYGGSLNAGILFSLIIPTIRVTSPNGGEVWTSGDMHDVTWTSTGSIANVNIDASIDSGSSWFSIVSGTANDGSYTCFPDTPSTTCLVRVSDTDGDPSDTSDAVFTIIDPGTETVSAPTTPTGPASGTTGASYDYSTNGSTSSLGHSVQYKFDWDDGSDSGWLAVGTTQASHSWSAAGTYNVKAMARCAEHTLIESLWSATLAVIISDPPTGQYNSPAQYKVLPEVIWASATGGGTWMSNVQVTDVSGGSIVSVYYNTGTTRRGPFQLWDNSGGAALSSAKYANLLETIDGLDADTFAYYGTVGAVEFITQDNNHKVQAAARTLNGYYAKTFTAVSLHDANTADTSRAMVVANLTNNASYRSTAGFFNPTTDSVTVEFTLLTYSFDNVILRVRPTSGAGKVACFGATVDNTTNDPAAHVAVQGATGFDNGPGSLQILPEAIWATATGGGTWVSEVQIVDTTGGSVVSVY